MVCRLLPCLLLCLIAASTQTPAAAAPPAPEPRPLFSRISGLFDFQLPDLDPPGTIKLIFYPHISDLIRRDYLRTEVGFRWTLNHNFELSAEASTYVTHGLGGGSDGYGIGELRLGTKYAFKEWLHPGYETSVAFDFAHPNGSPPLDMTDGQNHYRPSLAILRHSPHNPKLTTFASVGLDIITPSSSRGTFGTNQPHDDSGSVTGGAIYDFGQIKFTVSATYATTAFLGDQADHFFYLRPSLLWYVPNKYSFKSRTQWIVGLGLRSTWGPDGYDFGVNTRVRAEITFRQVVAKIRERAKSKDTR